MKRRLGILGLLFAALIAANARAQVAVVSNANQEQMLASSDARLAANKRLVYDFLFPSTRFGPLRCSELAHPQVHR